MATRVDTVRLAAGGLALVGIIGCVFLLLVVQHLLFGILVLLGCLGGAAVLEDIGHRRRSESSETVSKPDRDNWWVLIGAVIVVNLGFPAASALLYVGGEFPPRSAIATALFYLVGGLSLLVHLAALVAIYYDRRYVQAISEWNPSSLYYFVAAPVLFLGPVVAVIYLVQRHRHVGTP